MPTVDLRRTRHQYPIFLLRHGETTWNKAGRLQGQLDAPLTPRGRAQATAAGRTLRPLLQNAAPVRIVTSPLGRAQRSTELVLESLAPLVNEIRVDERLKEISWGEFEGLTREQVKATAPVFWRRKARDRWTAEPPGGESFALLSERLQPVLDELLGHEQPVVVIAHGGVRRTLRGLYGGLQPAEILALQEPHDVVVRLLGGTMLIITIV